MMRLGKFLVNSVKFGNNLAKVTPPKFSPILRNMETFASSWENDLGKAIAKAKEAKKPLMLVIYRPWCTYCQYLAKQISNSNQLKKMEQFFVMAQVNEDETYLENKFAPDGGVRYVPRVLFLTPNGDVMKDVRNHKAYKDGTLYVYNEVKEIMESMNEVVKRYFMVSSENKGKQQKQQERKTAEKAEGQLAKKNKKRDVKEASVIAAEAKAKKKRMRNATVVKK